jgi:hypothetical protein
LGGTLGATAYRCKKYCTRSRISWHRSYRGSSSTITPANGTGQIETTPP